MTSCYVGGFATQEGHDMQAKKHSTYTHTIRVHTFVCVYEYIELILSNADTEMVKNF